jgi:Insertion element 4 transposase N-terminal/Transposase DDE domain
MTFVTISQDGLSGKVCQQMDVGLLQEVLPQACIEELLDTYDCWETREKKLNMVAMVYWLMSLHLYPKLSQRSVYAKLVSGLRTVRDDVAEEIPSKSAFSYRRSQLGSELLEELFHQYAGPQATEQTPGAFWRGMRLMALDGTRESVPDTDENRETFRYSNDSNETHSPFPQARVVLLVECGTHVICDAEIASCREGEIHCARCLVARHQWENTLLLWDSGFHANRALFQVRALGGHILGNLRKNVLPKPWVTLADGSYLTKFREHRDHRTGPEMVVRVITYTFTDPRIPGAGEQVYRLVTTLLDPFLYPAKDLAVLYHERWHVELVIGETRTWMRLSESTLRSRTACGVIQEIYALLLVHVMVRTLMVRAANVAALAPTSISFTATLHILDESLIPLGLVNPERRARMVESLIQEIGQQRLPKQRLRIQARVLKRAYPRYAHKKPEHWHAPPLEPDLDFHQILALVPTSSG